MSDYWGRDRFTQTEKKQEVLRDTFLSRAEAAADLEASGRFKKQNETRVTGSGSVPTYPAQPANSPYADNPVPPGAAIDQLGFAIDEQEPVGSPAEIERSLERPTPDPATTESSLPVVSVDRVGPEPIPPANSTEPGIGSTKSNRPKSFRRRRF